MARHFFGGMPAKKIPEGFGGCVSLSCAVSNQITPLTHGFSKNLDNSSYSSARTLDDNTDHILYINFP
jgi:hypothetical protein